MPQPTELALNVANDVDFQKRTRLLIADVAGDVLAEANTVTDHDERAIYAVRVLNNLAEEGKRAAFIVVAENLNAAAAVESHTEFTDTVLKAAIAAAWNQLAGVYQPEA